MKRLIFPLLLATSIVAYGADAGLTPLTAPCEPDCPMEQQVHHEQLAIKVTTVTPDMERIATVSVFGVTDPYEVEYRLAKKAALIGGRYYKVIHYASNDNSERGTAYVYK